MNQSIQTNTKRCFFEGQKYIVTYEGKEGTFLETFTGEGGEMVILRQGKDPIRLQKQLLHSQRTDWPPLPVQQLNDSGPDILGEKAMQQPLTLENIKKVMCPDFENGYLTLGYHTSSRNFTVDEMGGIWMQPEFSLERRRVYEPEEAGALGAIKPVQSFLNGYIPILCNVHRGEEDTLETIYLTEQGDCNFEYAVWIRRVVYENQSAQPKSITYENVGACGLGNRLPLEEDIFVDCFVELLDYWQEFEQEQTAVQVPEKELERTYKGTMMVLDNLRSGFRLCYGNEFYGLETHHNFPPNYISMIWVYAITGHRKIARGILEHFLTNAVDTKGRIIYRQGERQLYGFSGSEIGQLLWLIERVHDGIGSRGWILDQWTVLEKMGRQLCSAIAPSDVVEGAELIHMCAEADTNGRIYDYLQNSLWAIRGLESLQKLGMRYERQVEEFGRVAVRLRGSVALVCEKTQIDTPFGKVIPFQLDYTPLPLTLSKCRDSAYPMDDEALQEYLSGDINPRNDLVGEQNLLENNYAGYRYYLEMLSSCLLEERFEKSIVAIREQLGGQWLGMTRFMDGLDDWPAYNYAIYLMERGEIPRFQLLFYSHIRYHGNQNFHLYYEQVKCLDHGMRKTADSSVPCCALPVMMMTMMFCYETVDRSCVELLKGVPDHWRKGCFMGPIHLGGGTLSIRVTDKHIEAKLEGDFPEIRLYLGEENPKSYQKEKGVLRCGENYLVMRPESFRLKLKG